MFYYIIPFILIAACIAFGIQQFLKQPARPLTERLLSLLLPFVILVVPGNIIHKLLSMQSDGSSQQRIIAPFAIAAGEPVYSLPHAGAVLDALYWPISYFLYLPATVAATPAPALMLGGILTLLFTFGTISYLIFRTLEFTNPGARPAWNVTLLAAAWFLANSSPALRDSTTTIHCDAPALGLASLAGWFAFRAARRASRMDLVLAAAFVVASVGCKQTMAALAIAIPIYLFFCSGWRRAIESLLFIGLFFLITAIVICSYFGFENVYYNTILEPSRHPWAGTSAIGFPLLAIEELASHLLFPAIFIAGAISLRNSSQPRNAPTLREWLSTNPAGVFIIITILNIPLALLGRVKIGGFPNTLSVAEFPALLAALLVTKECLNVRDSASTAIKTILLTICSVCSLAQAPALFTYQDAKHIWTNGNSETVFHYLKQNPGRAWFPWHPLAAMLAERKLYHYIYGIVDMRLAGNEISIQHLRAHIPKDPEMIAFAPDELQFGIELLPEFSERGVDPELPGWTVYRKKNPK